MPSYDRARSLRSPPAPCRHLDGGGLPNRRQRRQLAPPKRGGSSRISSREVSGVWPVRSQGRPPSRPARETLPAESLGAVPHRRLGGSLDGYGAVSYTHLQAHETPEHLVC